MNLSHLLPLLAFVIIPTIFAVFNYAMAKKNSASVVPKFRWIST
jgi:hypothetical protein